MGRCNARKGKRLKLQKEGVFFLTAFRKFKPEMNIWGGPGPRVVNVGKKILIQNRVHEEKRFMGWGGRGPTTLWAKGYASARKKGCFTRTRGLGKKGLQPQGGGGKTHLFSRGFGERGGRGLSPLAMPLGRDIQQGNHPSGKKKNSPFFGGHSPGWWMGGGGVHGKGTCVSKRWRHHRNIKSSGEPISTKRPVLKRKGKSRKGFEGGGKSKSLEKGGRQDCVGVKKTGGKKGCGFGKPPGGKKRKNTCKKRLQGGDASLQKENSRRTAWAHGEGGPDGSRDETVFHDKPKKGVGGKAVTLRGGNSNCMFRRSYLQINNQPESKKKKKKRKKKNNNRCTTQNTIQEKKPPKSQGKKKEPTTQNNERPLQGGNPGQQGAKISRGRIEKLAKKRGKMTKSTAGKERALARQKKGNLVEAKITASGRGDRIGPKKCVRERGKGFLGGRRVGKKPNPGKGNSLPRGKPGKDAESIGGNTPRKTERGAWLSCKKEGPPGRSGKKKQKNLAGRTASPSAQKKKKNSREGKGRAFSWEKAPCEECGQGERSRRRLGGGLKRLTGPT